MPKSVRTTLAVDQKFLKPKIPFFGTFDLVPKSVCTILALDQMHY